jgi:16S rRNA (uracil1498-N3)-methyltransferase
MSSHRFFISQPLKPNDELALDTAVSRHISLSLRIRIGESITLFNGTGGEYSAQVMGITKRCVTVVVGEYSEPNRESALNVHLAIVISRGDRMDYAIQKATELGVVRITPLFSERCEVKLDPDRTVRRVNHWQQVVTSACEQSGRNVAPVVETPVTLDEHLVKGAADLRLILDPNGASLTASGPAPASIELLTGPEGGFSNAEIEKAEGQGYQPVKLGPRILRAETAPVVGLSLLQSIWGDL